MIYPYFYRIIIIINNKFFIYTVKKNLISIKAGINGRTGGDTRQNLLFFKSTPRDVFTVAG